MATASFATNEGVTSARLNDVLSQVVYVCTAATHPTGSEGRVIYETDTDRLLVYSGSAWVRISASSTAGRTGCVLRRAATQSISNTTDTAISWDTEDTDTDGFIAVTSDTITVPAGLGGIYGLTTAVGYASNPGTNSNVRFIFTGASGDYRTSSANSTVAYQNEGFGVIVALSATNTIKVQTFQSSGGANNATARFEMWRLCA